MLPTILTADLSVVMENGRITAQGKRRKLLETCELYARLHRMEFADSASGQMPREP